MYYKSQYCSPLGEMLMISDGESLTELLFKGEKYFAAEKYQGMRQTDDLNVFNDVKEWLELYFAGEKPTLSHIPMKPEGSPFRKTVLDILLEIPYGEVTTYGRVAAEAAERLGRKSMSSQAVGGAVGHNPISVIIPCHRVIGSSGSLTGYGGGIDRKIALLRLEGVDMKDMFIPVRGTAL